MGLTEFEYNQLYDYAAFSRYSFPKIQSLPHVTEWCDNWHN